MWGRRGVFKLCRFQAHVFLVALTEKSACSELSSSVILELKFCLVNCVAASVPKPSAASIEYETVLVVDSGLQDLC